MQRKYVIAGVVALACMTAGHAQQAGKAYVSTGWFHIAPQDSSEPLKVLSVGGSPINQSQPNTGAGLSNADTLGFTAGYFITDHIATEFVLGVPPKFKLIGEGVLNQFGEIGTAKQWSPTLLFKYYFNTQAKLQPYVGVGVTYTWFSHEKITNNAFQQGVLHGPTRVSTSSSFSPVFNTGLVYNFDNGFFVGASVSYLPFLSVKATLKTDRPTPVGTLTQVSQAKIQLDPLVTYVNIGYRF